MRAGGHEKSSNTVKTPKIPERLAAELRGPIARGTLASLSIRVGSVGLGFAMAVVTARLLGPEGYGAVALAVSLSILGATLAGFGIEALIIREVPRLIVRGNRTAFSRFLRFAGGVYAIGALLATGIAIALLAGNAGGDGPAREAFRFIPLLLPLFAAVAYLRGAARGTGAVTLAQAPFDLLRPAIMLLGLGLLWGLSGAPSTAAYMTLAVTSALATLAVALVLTLRRLRAAMPDAPGPAEPMRPLLTTAVPMFLISVIGLLLAEVTTYLLGAFSTLHETGLFQPVARIAPFLLIGSQAVQMRYMPRVSELWETGNHERLLSVTRRATLVTTGSAAALSVAVLALAPWILALFGREFVASAPALWWIAGAQILSAACGPVVVLLMMTGSPARLILPQAAGLAVNLAVGFWLIPTEGALGAAQAMAAGIVVWSLAGLFVVRRTLKADPSIFSVLRPGT